MFIRFYYLGACKNELPNLKKHSLRGAKQDNNEVVCFSVLLAQFVRLWYLGELRTCCIRFDYVLTVICLETTSSAIKTFICLR